MKTFDSIVSLTLIQCISLCSFTIAVEYIVINDAQNTEGGARFDAEIGVTYTKEIVETITYFIWDIFQQYNSSERVPVETVTLYIDANLEYAGLTTGGPPHKYINISSTFLRESQGDLKFSITWLMHHEMTHVFQWFGNPVPNGLLEGIADYMMLQSNFYPYDFAKPGYGDKWDQGYDVTARFLQYCEELQSGFVAGMNRMMKDDYSDKFFLDLMGKTVDQLWTEYKAKYSQI